MVDDDFYAAGDLASRLQAIGFEVVGTVPGVDEASKAIGRTRDLSAAVLDINLDGETVFPVADELDTLGLPFILATGYDLDVVPTRHYRSFASLLKTAPSPRPSRTLLTTGPWTPASHTAVANGGAPTSWLALPGGC